MEPKIGHNVQFSVDQEKIILCYRISAAFRGDEKFLVPAHILQLKNQEGKARYW